MDLRRSNRGFTLIEIVLVLAIAGLLMIVVFLAVSGAQRARRNLVRKHDAAAFIVAVQQYAGNNQLNQPNTQAEANALIANYFQNRVDPLTGAAYTVDFYDNDASHNVAAPALGHIIYFAGHVCGSETGSSDLVDDPPGFGVATHKYAVVMALEQGITYCLSGDN